MGNTRTIVTLTLLSALGITGCGAEEAEPPTASSSGISVVAAFGPLVELATRVAGPDTEVINLTANGVEPHDLEVRSDQIDAIQDATLVVFVGEGFQPSVEDAVRTRDGASLDLLSRVDPIDRAPDGHDPHFWLDPTRMGVAATAIAEELSRLVPADAEEHTARAAAYAGEMAALDAEFTAGLKTCQSRTFVTSHAAFAHLASRYDLEQVAVAGISPEIEPDPARLASVADIIQAKRVTTIFTEELVAPDVAEALARETGATVEVLSPIEGFSETDRAEGATYASKMRANLEALRRALSCR